MHFTAKQVLACVAARYGLTLEDLQSPCRARRFSWPRDIAMYLARQKTRASYPQIGRRINRHHTSVLLGVRRVVRRMQSDPEYAMELDSARREVETNQPHFKFGVAP